MNGANELIGLAELVNGLYSPYQLVHWFFIFKIIFNRGGHMPVSSVEVETNWLPASKNCFWSFAKIVTVVV
jgi:hypothetical protein